MTATLRLPKKTDKVRGVFHAIKGRTKTKIQARTGNITSKPATRVGGERPGEKFGKPEAYTEDTRPDMPGSFKIGAIAGLAGGSLGAGAIHSQQTGHDRQVAAQYQRKIHKARLGGETVHLITDVGTASAKRANRRWPKMSKTGLAAGATVGAGTEYAFASASRKQARHELDTQYKSKRNQLALKRINKRNTALEQYTPTRKERAKTRLDDAGKGALTGAVAYPAARYAGREFVHRSQTPPEYKQHRLPRKKIPLKKLGKQTAIAAGVLGAYSAAGHRSKTQYRTVSKARSMSDTELRHRQKVQGKIARTTSTLGLSGLGITGVAAVAARKGKVGTGTLKAIRKVPKLKNATPEGMKNAAINTGIVSGGIGGIGGFNQASIYSAESRRRKQAVPVKKDYGMDLGFFGEEGHALTHEQIEEEISKAWEPVARNYDPEAKRHARAKKYEAGGAAAATGLGGGAAHQAFKAGKLERTIRTAGQKRAASLPNVKVAQAAKHAQAMKHGKVAAGLAGAGALAAGGTALAHHGRKNSWQSYEKRDTTSAFGVDHSDNPNGQHRETEN